MVEELGMDGCKISEIESKRPVFSVFKLLAVKVKGCVRGADALFSAFLEHAVVLSLSG